MVSGLNLSHSLCFHIMEVLTLVFMSASTLLPDCKEGQCLQLRSQLLTFSIMCRRYLLTYFYLTFISLHWKLMWFPQKQMGVSLQHHLLICQGHQLMVLKWGSLWNMLPLCTQEQCHYLKGKEIRLECPVHQVCDLLRWYKVCWWFNVPIWTCI